MALAKIFSIDFWRGSSIIASQEIHLIACRREGFPNARLSIAPSQPPGGVIMLVALCAMAVSYTHLANALKRHTIEHLDHYLEEFEANVAAHGGKVMYCQDATEVADFVLGLAKERAAQLIVKSKSMTTEEIDLNERLEHHNLESVETDLGEYILQLAHQRPYHRCV